MRFNVIIIAVMHCIGLLAAGSWAAVAATVEKPTSAIEPQNCVTAECHVEIKASKVIHGPVSVNACDACHELSDAADHTFTTAREKAELCTYCHEFPAAAMPVVHKPVTLGECIGCHDPHGGLTRAMMREKSVPELCGRCHESMTAGNKHIHTPVKEGACDACHAPHGSKFPNLVTAIGPDLCLACHDNLERNLADATFVHKGLEDGCLTCHDVHGSNVPRALVQEAPELCYGCHEVTRTQVQQATHKHSPVTEDQTCMTCHAPHDSDFTAMMKDLPVSICMSCHDRPINGYVAAVPEVNDRTMFPHGPVADGQCSGCHGVHGGDRPKMLTHVMSSSLYQPFSRAQFELCFSCHDARLAESESAGGMTKFRDGDRNLHFVHANEGERGRNCRVCHATHAAANPHNIRETFQYGKWNMPIGFTATETGGSCDPGCHVLYPYDRDNPAMPTTAPATQPYPMIAQRATPPTSIQWTMSDMNGRAITVPDPQRSTVLLILGASQPQQGETLKLLASAGERARIIVIVSGPGAQKQAQQLAGSSAIVWPIIPDETATLAAQHAVFGWPVTLIIAGDGSELARIRGTSQSLPMKLAAYLDFAEQRIDRAQLDQIIAPPEPTAAELSKKTQRMAATAQRLVEQGNVDQARSLLSEALKLQPRNAQLQVAMIDTLIAMKQGQFAVPILGKIAPDALPAAEMELLRGRVYIAIDQWSRGRQFLENALRLNPDLPDAHYHMGRVCEHEQKWQQAAEHYRIVHELRGKAR